MGRFERSKWMANDMDRCLSPAQSRRKTARLWLLRRLPLFEGLVDRLRLVRARSSFLSRREFISYHGDYRGFPCKLFSSILGSLARIRTGTVHSRVRRKRNSDEVNFGHSTLYGLPSSSQSYGERSYVRNEEPFVNTETRNNWERDATDALTRGEERKRSQIHWKILLDRCTRVFEGLAVPWYPLLYRGEILKVFRRRLGVFERGVVELSRYSRPRLNSRVVPMCRG